MALTAGRGIQAPSALPLGAGKPSPRAHPPCHRRCCWVRLGRQSLRGCPHAGPRLARTDPCACDSSVPTAWVLAARFAVQRPPGGPPKGQGVWRKAARMRTQRSQSSPSRALGCGAPRFPHPQSGQLLSRGSHGPHVGSTSGKALGRCESPCEPLACHVPVPRGRGGGGVGQAGVLDSQRCELKFCQCVSAQRARLSPGH